MLLLFILLSKMAHSEAKFHWKFIIRIQANIYKQQSLEMLCNTRYPSILILVSELCSSGLVSNVSNQKRYFSSGKFLTETAGKGVYY